MPDISSEVKKAIRDTERKCISECSDSLNKSTLSAAYCTDTSLSKMERLAGILRENMLPGILKRLQLKRENIGSDPIMQLCKKNSQINTHAEGLPVYPGTKFAMD